ncbi:MAG: hypothetical protein ACQET8_22530 [Bacillota bacterium]
MKNINKVAMMKAYREMGSINLEECNAALSTNLEWIEGIEKRAKDAGHISSSKKVVLRLV